MKLIYILLDWFKYFAYLETYRRIEKYERYYGNQE